MKDKIEILTSFLKDKGAYDQFIGALEEDNKTIEDTMTLGLEDCICEGFSWRDSIQGSSFWSNIETEWLKHLDIEGFITVDEEWRSVLQ